jgi:hypothetical protein
VTNRRHWLALFRDKSDEYLQAFLSDAQYGEQHADAAWAKAVHRKRRLAAEREIRRRASREVET